MPRNDLTPRQEELANAVTAALRAADIAIRAAIREAASAGVSANEIARRADSKVSGVRGYSRPVVLEILGADDIRSTALAALEEAQLEVGDRCDEQAHVVVWEGAVRSVWVCLAAALRGHPAATRRDLAARVETALSAAGLRLRQNQKEGDTRQALGDGETMEIYKT
ncbi:hypothetical protein [Nonomuraea dietziae]|uniref:Uncharacterized protein n=1 Tax=Nonomuraea dietziae TaxID=65515 RepID=A0A7W5VSM7_9ACTN|nr:hypothetical protein [Nonomuraea dietziae]MBB3733772.1 hypothetical protein [Nonomuraea dietziae]